ncbi:hypothetical protein ACOBQX_03805 [Actinokineospora sp. G85]|uniref:hypothetical protein n=1 Tax=Actinokineospora sp. G85 TaxID=3406626 RepID=UPI003C79274F
MARDLSVPPAAPLPVRLAALGQVNINPDIRAALAAQPLATALRANPAALTESLFAATGHDEQVFLNTCVASAVNTGVRGRVPTLAGLLHVGRAIADGAERSVNRATPEARTRADRIGRTQEELVGDRVAEARAEFTEIETRALDLVTRDQTDPEVRRGWRDLTDQWSRVTQKLAAADLTVAKVPVLTRKVVPGNWLLSASLALPLAFDRGSRRYQGIDGQVYVSKIQGLLAMEPNGSLFGHDVDAPSTPLTPELATPGGRDAFWQRLSQSAGTVVTTPGHTVHVQATRAAGEQVFVLDDPKNANPAMLTPTEFADWARESKAQAPTALFPAENPHTPVTMGDATPDIDTTPNRDVPPDSGGTPDRAATSDRDTRDDDGDAVFSAVIDLWTAADNAGSPESGVFGPPAPRAPQPHLAGQDHANLTAAEGAELLNRLDLTKPVPTHDDLTKPALAAGPDNAVERSSAGERRYTWAGERRLPPLPELLELPRLVHSVWLGGALRAAGAVLHLRDNLVHTAQTAGDRWKAVLWTDVSRADVVHALRRLGRWPVLTQLRHDDSGEDERFDLDHLTAVADLYALAEGAGIALVDVNEVFHDEAPMTRHDDFSTELHRRSRDGRDAAAAIAANEILSRFGGVHADPRLRADDLGPAADVVNSPAGWAGGNGLMAMPKGHPIADLHGDALAGAGPARPGSLPGDEALPDLARLAGLPGLAGFSPGSAEGFDVEEPTADTLAGLTVDEAAKWVIESLVQDLLDRDGDLNLLAVAEAVEGHPRADELWTVVLAFLATRPEFADLVRSVTLEGVDEHGAPRRVDLPARAADLIELADAAPVESRPGERTTPATLSWPDWL